MLTLVFLLLFSISFFVTALIIYFKIHLTTEREIAASIQRNNEIKRINAFISIAKKYNILETDSSKQKSKQKSKEKPKEKLDQKDLNPLEQKLTSLGKRRL